MMTLADGSVSQPGRELAQLDIVGSHAFHGREDAMEDMIGAAVPARALDR